MEEIYANIDYDKPAIPEERGPTGEPVRPLGDASLCADLVCGSGSRSGSSRYLHLCLGLLGLLSLALLAGLVVISISCESREGGGGVLTLRVKVCT